MCKVNLALGDEICDNIQGQDSSLIANTSLKKPSPLFLNLICWQFFIKTLLIDWAASNQLHKEEQAEVQKYVSTLKIYNSVLQAIPSVLFALIAGPWSDIHGRKALIISSTFGYCISNLIFMINAHFFYELKAEYLLLEVRHNVMIFFLTSQIMDIP